MIFSQNLRIFAEIYRKVCNFAVIFVAQKYSSKWLHFGVNSESVVKNLLLFLGRTYGHS
ncbi:Uncharacterised protein [Haemophilus parainfluenzae]|uniref:Uncharacterized protein n=1 Tax=Haemophilus parainfluenzae TaxID=729 RepID=A0A3S4WSC0_HAEPA|nr:Uncharacterised protein [Haemophilus parainfluenzae]